jgi:hypothetical protein
LLQGVQDGVLLLQLSFLLAQPQLSLQILLLLLAFQGACPAVLLLLMLIQTQELVASGGLGLLLLLHTRPLPDSPVLLLLKFEMLVTTYAALLLLLLLSPPELELQKVVLCQVQLLLQMHLTPALCLRPVRLWRRGFPHPWQACYPLSTGPSSCCWRCSLELKQKQLHLQPLIGAAAAAAAVGAVAPVRAWVSLSAHLSPSCARPLLKLPAATCPGLY